MDGAASLPIAAGQAASGRRELWRLGVLRWFTLLAFGLMYVAVPALLFERTRSVALVGLAMLAEGVARALLSLWVGRLFQASGGQGSLQLACALRLAALLLLGYCVLDFSVPLVALASTLFYCGHFFATLEQELRCARLGPRAVAGQTVHRIAEVLAPPLGFAVAFAASRTTHEYAVLLGAGAAAVLAHGALYLGWFANEPAVGSASAAVPAPHRLAPAARHVWHEPALRRGLLACIIGFGLFGWAVLATPFALTGRHLAEVALDSAEGIALFKAIAAVLGVGGALLWGRLLGRPHGARLIAAATVLAPLLFALAITTPNDTLAVMLLALVCAMLLGLFSWQRGLRHQHTAAALFPGVTALCLALECLGVSLAGLALLANAPWALCGFGSVLLAVLLWPEFKRRRDDSYLSKGSPT